MLPRESASIHRQAVCPPSRSQPNLQTLTLHYDVDAWSVHYKKPSITHADSSFATVNSKGKIELNSLILQNNYRFNNYELKLL